MTPRKSFPRDMYWQQLAAGSAERARLGAFWQGIIDGFAAPTRLCQRPESRYTHFNSVEYAWLSVGDAMAHALDEYEREVIPREQAKRKTAYRTRRRISGKPFDTTSGF